MGDINKISSGSLAKSNKVNEIIRKINAIENMKVRPGEGDESPGFNVSDNNSELVVTSGGSGGGSSGDGLPEFPSVIPLVPDFKGVLAWSVAEGEALWLQGTPVSPTEVKPYVDVMIYDPTSTVDNFSLQRTEFIEVIICRDGAPVTGNIYFVEATP